MIATHCSSCDRKVLLPASRITGIQTAAGRHHVHVNCRCGSTLRWSSQALLPR